MRDPCGPCGLCCRSYLVPMFGHDFWWIATRRGLPPESFAFVAEQETTDPLGFRLAAEGPTYGLALLKEEPMSASQPCIFLVAAGEGITRCGIYPDRPITCRTYPMSKLAGRVYQRERTLCPPGSWEADDLLPERWIKDLQRLRYRRDVYVEVIARWNAAVQYRGGADPLPPKAFCDYVLAVYQEIAEVEREIGPEGMAALETSWASMERRNESDSTGELVGSRAEEPGWISHLRRLREVIDRFFPGLPPQPFQPLVVEPTG